MRTPFPSPSESQHNDHEDSGLHAILPPAESSPLMIGLWNCHCCLGNKRAPQSESIGSQKQIPESHTDILASKRSVLIVEDEPEIVRLIQLVLESHDFQVFACKTAELGIDMIHKASNTIDLIICDMILPGMNGVMMSKQVKKYHPNIEFLFMSGYSTHFFQEFAAISNSPNFLPKPFSIANLIDKVQTILSPSA